MISKLKQKMIQATKPLVDNKIISMDDFLSYVEQVLKNQFIEGDMIK